MNINRLMHYKYRLQEKIKIKILTFDWFPLVKNLFGWGLSSTTSDFSTFLCTTSAVSVELAGSKQLTPSKSYTDISNCDLVTKWKTINDPNINGASSTTFFQPNNLNRLSTSFIFSFHFLCSVICRLTIPFGTMSPKLYIKKQEGRSCKLKKKQFILDVYSIYCIKVIYINIPVSFHSYSTIYGWMRWRFETLVNEEKHSSQKWNDPCIETKVSMQHLTSDVYTPLSIHLWNNRNHLLSLNVESKINPQ